MSAHTNLYTVYVHVCVFRHVRMFTLKREKAFQLPHAPPGCPGAAGEEARDITQLLNCYSQVSPSAGAVLIEAETPWRSTAIYTYTHILQAGVLEVWAPDCGSLAWWGITGARRGADGWAKGGAARHQRTQHWASGEATCHSISPMMNRPGFFSLSLVSLGNFRTSTWFWRYNTLRYMQGNFVLPSIKW